MTEKKVPPKKNLTCCGVDILILMMSLFKKVQLFAWVSRHNLKATGGVGSMMISITVTLERKLLSCSHCQEFGQLADLASDWLFKLV